LVVELERSDQEGTLRWIKLERLARLGIDQLLGNEADRVGAPAIDLSAIIPAVPSGRGTDQNEPGVVSKLMPLSWAAKVACSILPALALSQESQQVSWTPHFPKDPLDPDRTSPFSYERHSNRSTL
jgi:hypothetical protein